jgi:hypothetical protein
LARTTTCSPTVSASRVSPSGWIVEIGPASTSCDTGAPSAPAVSIVKYVCGLVNANFVSLPATRISLV